ncbi:MAG: YdcF family protein [Bacteriovoracia bacterium]
MVRHLATFKRVALMLLVLFVGMGVGVLSLAYMTAGIIYDHQDSATLEELPEVDVIVCLSGGKGRIEAATNLWFAYHQKAQFKPNLPNTPAPGPVGRPPVLGRPPILFIAGMGPRANWKVFEKQVRKEVLPYLNTANVVLETDSENTRENAEVFSVHARQRGWKRILLMTSSYHIRRAHYLFEKTLNPARDAAEFEIETMTIRQEPFSGADWKGTLRSVEVTMMEYLKWVYYRTLF